MKNNKFLRNILIYICALGITTVAGFALLAMSLFLPQDRIRKNVVESTAYMQLEGSYPIAADRTLSSMFDNWSESIILMESDCMYEENYSYILTNPFFTYDGEYIPLDFLAQYIEDECPQPAEFYTRYWMGFRSVYRLLLTFFHHYQIKTYMAAGFFVLFSVVLLQIAKNVDNRTAISFAISMMLIRPNIVSVSVQYSCCFFIALFGMLLVPWISKNAKYEGLFFAELGMLTMYFDFYTTPIVTFGLPIIYLYAINVNRGESFGIKRVVKDAAWWFFSYIGMWITKLLLTAMFTSAPAFDAAFSRAAMWLRVGEHREMTNEYSPIKALECVWQNVTVYVTSAKIANCMLILFLVFVGYLLLRRKIDLRVFRKNSALILVALLPILWLCVACKPTIIHSYFQYRSVIVAIWAIGVYFVQILKKEKSNKEAF